MPIRVTRQRIRKNKRKRAARVKEEVPLIAVKTKGIREREGAKRRGGMTEARRKGKQVVRARALVVTAPAILAASPALIPAGAGTEMIRRETRESLKENLKESLDLGSLIQTEIRVHLLLPNAPLSPPMEVEVTA